MTPSPWFVITLFAVAFVVNCILWSATERWLIGRALTFVEMLPTLVFGSFAIGIANAFVRYVGALS